MSNYAYSEERIEQLVAQSRRIQFFFRMAGIVVLIATPVLIIYRPTSPIFHKLTGQIIWAFIMAIFVHPLINGLRHRKSGPDAPRDSFRATRVEIASGAVSVSYLKARREIMIREISRAEEPAWGGGLYLRSSNRYRWILIPRKLDGYDDIKREISLEGVSIAETSIPPNLEEFGFVLLFVATLICPFIVHDTRVLKVNLIIAVLLGLGGFYVISSNPDNLADPHLRKGRFGAFIPALGAAVGLWFALHGGW